MFDFTPLCRPYFVACARRTDKWIEDERAIQLRQLVGLLRSARNCEIGRRYDFAAILKASDPYRAYRAAVPVCSYEDIRSSVMRMVNGEKDVLWPGVCRRFAQSSGTSGGKSKFIPITGDSLRRNHYIGARDSVSHYLSLVPESRMFAGKGLILGGSFANELNLEDKRVKVGDLSATLIDRIGAFANFFRVPSKEVALLADWSVKLPALAEAAAGQRDITNLSGVPSWFLVVLRKVLQISGKNTLDEVWPQLEVFFHGGISFDPYRAEYAELAGPNSKMRFLETYNASEGFFATQNDFDDPAMLLIADGGVFYEFRTPGAPDSEILPLWEVVQGKVYEMLISAPNGLWRYSPGDTVRIESVNPVKISIAGRTKSFINAFGEELMEQNAEHAMAKACGQTGCSVRNYTAAPVYASGGKRGCHQWLIEWEKEPENIDEFAAVLDSELQNQNSDYQAKRSHAIFLDAPQIVSVPDGVFDRWLQSVGSGKLGGQRKVPRLHNDRSIADSLIALIR